MGIDEQKIVCIHCGEPIFDNGTVYVHLRSTGSVDQPKTMIQTQWCYDRFGSPMAEAESRMADWMILPKHSDYPEYHGFHRRDDWCSKVGCQRVCDAAKIAEIERLYRDSSTATNPESLP